MATSLDSISGIGANARKLAKLLQAKAPEGHMLAYINPREAALLKAHGGSGKPEPETGIPSFEEEGTPFNDYEYGPAPTATSYPVSGFESEPIPEPVTSAPAFDYSLDRIQPSSYSSGSSGIDTQLSSFPQAREIPAFDTSRPSVDPETQRLMGGKTEEEKSLIKQVAEKTGLKEDTLGRLGLAGLMGLLGGRTARAAARAGQGGKAEMQALAAPYQQKGQQLQAQAQRGELTPQAMQSLQAAQAQAAQGATQRGGVGAAQAQMQIEQLRQQLLQQQYDYGLKLSGIGDNIALGAIKTGLEADRYVQGVNNSFYQNMAYIAAGMTPGGQR
jgi:hypothetical protein